MHRTFRSDMTRQLLILALLILVLVWVVSTLPTYAQGEETAAPSMTDELVAQPNILAPMCVPAVLALGGILTLMAFLGWVVNHMAENGA
jgi:hypothetical protein